MSGQHGYTEKMPATPRHPSIDSGWQQLEDFMDQLHQSARAPIERTGFYQQLLNDCVTTLAAVGGAVWLPTPQGRWELCYQINLDQVVDRKDADTASAHQALLHSALTTNEPQLFLPRSGAASSSTNPTDAVLVLGAVGATSGGKPPALIELFMRTGSSPATERGWQELLNSVCGAAAEFHVYEELRTLQAEHGLHDQSLALLRRVHRSTDLGQTALEIANEGRRFVDGDRLSIVWRRGKKWHHLAASGVDRLEVRSDASKQLEQLAERIASWDEPLDYHGSTAEELPGELAELLERYVDASHARRLVAVPITLATSEDDTRPEHKRPELVLIAELFGIQGKEFSCQRVVELAALCEPAFRQAVWLNRFPLRTTLRWADRWARWTQSWGITRAGLLAVTFVTAVAALSLVQTDFEIEAPATLVPLVERDVFATTSGTVREVHTQHGTDVKPGDVLAVLEDPQLALEIERVQGESATVRERLDAIAAVRTDRRVREEKPDGRLPLSAESQQLEKQLASLMKQQEILEQLRAALTIRSPIAGKVITLDVQNLLRARPVERGQILFTVANPTAGWRLEAEVPQDRVGHVLAAQRDAQSGLPVRFRLAGELEQTFDGHLESVSATTVMAGMDLELDPQAVQARIVVDASQLPAARPGMSAQVRIACGRRSLGYVWLHDVWETLYSWWSF